MALKLCKSDEYIEYQKQTLLNAKAIGNALIERLVDNSSFNSCYVN